MSATVFDAFPNVVVSDVWQLGVASKSTITGAKFEFLNYLDVVVDEVAETRTAKYDGVVAQIESDTLLYVKPDQLPTLNMNAYQSDYLLYNSDEGEYYAIIKAAVGKNQENGTVEHVEFEVRQTTVDEVLANGSA